MLPAGGWQHRGCIIPHIELTGIINKPLLLHLVGCLYYLYQWYTFKQISDKEIHFLIKYIKSVRWKVAKRLSYIEDARCLKVKACLIRLTPSVVVSDKLIVSFASISIRMLSLQRAGNVKAPISFAMYLNILMNRRTDFNQIWCLVLFLSRLA